MVEERLIRLKIETRSALTSAVNPPFTTDIDSIT